MTCLDDRCQYTSLEMVQAAEDGSDNDDISVGSADQDLKPSPRKGPSKGARRSRGASTMDRINLGYPKSGNRFRLASHSDEQSAVMWMEGKGTRRPRNDTLASVTEEPPASQDPEKSGDSRGPLLPIALVLSLLVGVVCLLVVHRQVVNDVFGLLTSLVFAAVVGVVFLVTAICLAMAALSDPGQVPKNVDQIPQRAHKNFMYPRHLLRYDHYCRWIMNCIGLKNHREFFVMLVGFATIALGGFCIDLPLFVLCIAEKKQALAIGIGLHLIYSAGFSYYVIPIFRLHIRFVSRNELANEWKGDLFYVVEDIRNPSDTMWVGDLDPIEFNERYDEFQYDPTRNPWDKGCPMNCCLFWCTSRSSAREMGEF